MNRFCDTRLEMLFSFLKHQEHPFSVLVRTENQPGETENEMVKGCISGLWLFYINIMETHKQSSLTFRTFWGLLLLLTPWVPF